MCSPLFSIVIPTYNRDLQTRRAIQSCLAQSEQSLEVIVVDDGSTLTNYAISKSIDDPRVYWFRTENRGANAARNYGVQKAQGKYIAFLDSDDAFYPDKLSVALEYMRNDCDIFFSRVNLQGESHSAVRPDVLYAPDTSLPGYLLHKCNSVRTSSIVVKKQLAGSVRWREGLRYGDDTDFLIRASSVARNVQMSPKVLVEYSDSISSDRLSLGATRADIFQLGKSISKFCDKGLMSSFRVTHYSTVGFWGAPKRVIFDFLYCLFIGNIPKRKLLVCFARYILPFGVYTRIKQEVLGSLV